MKAIHHASSPISCSARSNKQPDLSRSQPSITAQTHGLLAVLNKAPDTPRSDTYQYQSDSPCCHLSHRRDELHLPHRGTCVCSPLPPAESTRTHSLTSLPVFECLVLFSQAHYYIHFSMASEACWSGTWGCGARCCTVICHDILTESRERGHEGKRTRAESSRCWPGLCVASGCAPLASRSLVSLWRWGASVRPELHLTGEDQSPTLMRADTVKYPLTLCAALPPLSEYPTARWCLAWQLVLQFATYIIEKYTFVWNGMLM